MFGTSQLVLLLVVLVRTSGIMIVAPVFGTNEVPPVVRGLLAFTLALLLWPTQIAAGATAVLPNNLVDLSLLLAAETLIGLVLGMGVMILFAAFQLTGHVIGQLGGMSLADVFNPGFDDNMPLFAHFLYMVTLAVYALVGGHRMLLGGLLDTFATIPPGSAVVPVDGVTLITTLLTQSFELGLRAAAPAMVALLSATIILGLIGRALPQLNLMALGFGFNALVTFGILTVSLGGVGWLLQENLEPVLDEILQMFAETSPNVNH
jgi:flagellar biosynthetic protein FliR